MEEQENKEVIDIGCVVVCKYKKACVARDWKEQAYKCCTCKKNVACTLPEEKKTNWPKLLRSGGWF